ncbi:MAG TPA: glutathione S-transferase family protein [Thermoplasmata archaeon]|nr:glutathione S-transferase family protein [Thermoplasmata archaeon]
MPESVRLFWAPWSHYCVCAELQLALKGIPATLVRVPYHDKTELIAATGQDYIPALDWSGRTVPWKEIPDFLESQRPNPTLYPFGQRGLASLVERWGHQVLEDRAWHYALAKMPETFDDPRERWVFEEIQNRVRGPWHLIESRRPEFRDDLFAELAWVEATLDGREWLLGMPSLADCGVYGGLSPMRTVGEEIPESMPNLRAWVARVEAVRAGGPAAGPPSAPARS